MKIIKRGVDPEEKEYRVNCVCGSELLITKKDAIGYRGWRQILIFECPVCKVHFNAEGLYR